MTVTAPINNKLAPPGYYLVHVLNGAGVPSVGKFIKIPGSAEMPPSDTIAPTVAVTSPANGATISGPSTGVTITVAGTASDESGGSGIQKVEVQGWFKPIQTGNSYWTWRKCSWSTWSASDVVTSRGSHTITARATDNAGNTRDATITVTVAFSGGGGGTYTSIYSVSAAGGSYINLNTGGLRRAGEWMHRSTSFNSSLIGQSVKRVNVILIRAGSPTGQISVVVRRFSDDSIVHTFGTIDASTLTTASTNIHF